MQNNQPDGTVPDPQLAPQAPANPEQLSPTADPAAAQAPASPGPDVAALQSQLAAAEQARQLAERQAHDHQAAFTRAQQQLQALAGAVPKQDPLIEYLKPYVARGISEEDAMVFARRDLVQDQRFAQLENNMNSRMQAPSIAHQVVSAAAQTSAAAFADPSVAQAVMQQLTQDAQNGSRIDPELAKYYAYQEIGRRAVEGSGQQAPTRQQPPAFQSMVGPLGGFQPAPALQQQSNPEADKLAKQMADYARIPTK